MTTPPPELTEQHRRAQVALRATVLRDLLALWPTLDPARLDATFPAWATFAGQLITQRRALSSSLAARYLRAVREAAGVAGPDPVVLADPVDPEQMATALRVTSVVAVKKATARGVPAGRALTDAYVLSSGSATRLVLDGGRDTIRTSLARDGFARGWRRVTGGQGCDFCRMLAGRGAVYAAATADFQSHDHCSCVPEPVYD